MSKKALGKGIDALFTGNEKSPTPPEGSAASIQSVPIEKVKPNPFQPRKYFDETALADLAQSIKQQGILQPLLAEKSGDSYIIVAGERRYRAALIAGIPDVPIWIKEFSEEEKLEIALIENLQREDLTPIEEAKAIKTILEKTGLSQEKIAEKIGKNRTTVTNALRLLKLPEDIQKAIDSGEITAGHARALLSIINPADQRVLFDRIRQSLLSVRRAEEEAARLNSGGRASKTDADKKDPPREKPAEIREIEQKLIDTLGTKVDVKGNGRTGKIEIAYYSGEDLERVLDIITG